VNRVATKPALLRWARERVRRSAESLRGRFPKLDLWERGEAQPTLKQLEAFAQVTHVPVGYLLLPEPPAEEIPIPDLRTIKSREIGEPTPDLLDMIYLCQRRQDWYRDFARSEGEDRRAFVGSARIEDPVDRVAAGMREALGFDITARRRCPTWTEALRTFIEQADAIGVLVMVSGVVGSNNRRKLNPQEFRGLALSDDLAPLVFVNGADTKAAQMFTLAHELAHLWLGASALSDVGPASLPRHRLESWCNRVAAELLVPLAALRAAFPGGDPLEVVADLARHFKVSTLVVLRRLLDARYLSRGAFQEAYTEELDRLLALPRGSGANFYLTQAARVSRRFARALVVSTLEGQTLYRDAFQMLGVRKEETFRDLGRSLGYPL
jgi:Zn-dependent peptidase ImmA (M78 family)